MMKTKVAITLIEIAQVTLYIALKLTLFKEIFT